MLCFLILTIWFITYFELRISLFSVEYNLNTLGFSFNLLNSIFISTVILVSIFVKYFSIYYIRGTKLINDFNLFLNMFILSIILLLRRNSWWILILGWEILGISSFYLVRFYNSFLRSNGGVLTIMTNRIGDITLIFTFTYFLLLGEIFSELNRLLVVLIIFSLITKRSQFPFFSWLPSAMRAPTPISSLVHSSTLVTSGFFLLIKFNWRYFLNYQISYLWGILTLIFGSFSAILDSDFKKVVAFSTLSQLGFLIILFSSGNLFVVLFHLVSHAFFKRLLFINLGILIHNSFSNQNKILFSRRLLSSYSHLSFFFLTLINLRALPFILGFYSKENGIFNLLREISILHLVLFLIAISLTFGYSFRLIRMINVKNVRIISSHSSLLFNTFSSVISLLFLLILGYFWRLNFCHFELRDNLIILLLIFLGILSYFLLSWNVPFIFYYLTRFIQFNLNFTELKWLDQTSQLYWIPIYPISWISRASWILLLFLIISYFI
jgi:NADH-ubiquinone oxidoreductase chain 5